MTEEQRGVPTSDLTKPVNSEMVAIIPVEGWYVPFDESLVRFHEAAHAVYADHMGLPVERLWAGDGARPSETDQRVLGSCAYRRFPKARHAEDECRFACLHMTGPYAAWRKAKGEAMPCVPFEIFVATAEVQPDRDIGRALDCLRRSVEEKSDSVEEVYEAVCREVARWVDDSWRKIEAVAEQLREHGCLSHWEVHRPIWETRGTSEPPTDSLLAAMLEQWDKDDIELWKAPGGWLYELMDDVAPSARHESEEEEW